MRTYKHHVIPFHEWKRRINPTATRFDREFNAVDNVVYLTLPQHAQVHFLLYELTCNRRDQIAWGYLSGQIGQEEAIRQSIILANTGRKHTPEQRAAQSLRMKGRQHGLGWVPPIEWRQRQSKRLIGVPRTKEFCLKQSLRRRGERARIVTCPHCSISGGAGNMTRYHFDNCKLGVH